MCPDYDNTKLTRKERVKEKGGWLWTVPEELQTEAEELHDAWLRTASQASKERHAEVRATKQKIKEWIEEDPELVEFGKKARIKYLNREIKRADQEWHSLRDLAVWHRRINTPLEEIEGIERVAEGLDKKIANYRAEIRRLRGGNAEGSEQKELITDEMIERAREYPIENLIEIGRNGRAKCIFHQGEDYNMDVRQNFAYCYVCGESGDPIKIYMQLHGANFREAVLALQ